jgi:hypothetical protein
MLGAAVAGPDYARQKIHDCVFLGTQEPTVFAVEEVGSRVLNRHSVHDLE